MNETLSGLAGSDVNERFDCLLSEVLRLKPVALIDELAFARVEGWDSLRHISLVAGLETTFGIELTFDEIVGMHTVGDARRLLKARAKVAR